MRCDTKTGAITVAVITIILAGFNLVKFSVWSSDDFEKSLHHYQKHPTKAPRKYDHDLLQKSHSLQEDDEDFGSKIRGDYDKKTETVEEKKLEKEDQKEVDNNPLHANLRFFKIVRIYSIVIYTVSILTSLLTFVAAPGNSQKNQKYRHFLLPYVIYHGIVIIKSIGFLVYSGIKYHYFIGGWLVISTLVNMMFFFMMILHFRMLCKRVEKPAEDASFGYAQLDNEVKQPIE